MPDSSPRYPSLVSMPAGPGGRPAIRARRCACGHIAHPPVAYGCERCGRDSGASETVELDARGALIALATVHVHPKLPTPFALGRIRLDAGPTVEAWLGVAHGLAIGDRVVGTFVQGGVNDSGVPVLDCHFVAEGGK